MTDTTQYVNQKQVITEKASRAARYLLPGNVYDAALNRIRWIYDEFTEVAVSTSGGKDSTVVINLTLQIARERDRLPLKVFWLDQECEFEATVNYQRQILRNTPDIDGHWYQIPFNLFNAANHSEPWLHVWGEGETWVRPKEPDSIHVNPTKGTRFVELLHLLGDEMAPDGAVLTGVRSEESPNRRLGLTGVPCYKWVTWGRPNRHHWGLHPIYDWSYRDVWKAIDNNGWAYNRMYDWMHQYGIPGRTMRVSNYHHETALTALWFLQEIEPDTWEAATRRLSGINTVGHIGRDDFFVHDLPYMFTSWVEYRDYLVENLVPDPAHREMFYKQFEAIDRQLWYIDPEQNAKAGVQAVVANDLYGTKLGNYRSNNRVKNSTLETLGITKPAPTP